MTPPKRTRSTYESEFLSLRRMDCMELMASLPDKAFDLAIVDPPYGINAEQGTNRAARKQFQAKQRGWDSKPPEKAYWTELFRLSKNQIVWGANHFIEDIPTANSKHWIVWDKLNPDRCFADCELAWGSRMDNARIYKTMRVQDLNRLDGGKIHPTQKPVNLYSWLLTNYANPGDRILDTHLGSGSIAIACHYARHHLTACEIDQDYFDAACDRIERETAQEGFVFEQPQPQEQGLPL